MVRPGPGAGLAGCLLRIDIGVTVAWEGVEDLGLAGCASEVSGLGALARL